MNNYEVVRASVEDSDDKYSCVLIRCKETGEYFSFANYNDFESIKVTKIFTTFQSDSI
jgi:hypothetical protein